MNTELEMPNFRSVLAPRARRVPDRVSFSGMRFPSLRFSSEHRNGGYILQVAARIQRSSREPLFSCSMKTRGRTILASQHNCRPTRGMIYLWESPSEPSSPWMSLSKRHHRGGLGTAMEQKRDSYVIFQYVADPHHPAPRTPPLHPWWFSR